MLGEPGFQVGDAAVLEAQVGPGCFESFVEAAVVGAELSHAVFERGVLRGDSLDIILCPFGFQVADAVEEFADAIALGHDLGVGGLERILGVEGPLTPGQLSCVVSLDNESTAFVARLSDGFSDSGFRVLIGVEKRPG
jgi:hypothetical protein